MRILKGDPLSSARWVCTAGPLGAGWSWVARSVQPLVLCVKKPKPQAMGFVQGAGRGPCVRAEDSPEGLGRG